MNGRYLLDTNIIIALFANESSVIEHLQNSSEIFIPVIAAGELYYGARKSRRLKENLERIDEFITNNTILPCDVDTSKLYGNLKDKLRQKGRPIPENDIWIAALAVQHDLVLVSKDLHFMEIEGVKTVKW